MEWLKELLKNAGFDESKIDGFVTEFNKEVPKHLIPKEKYNSLSETKKQLEKDIQDRDNQLSDLKKNVGDNEDLKQKIQALQDENKQAKANFEKQTKELQLNTALKLSLAGKVHDPDIVLGLLDKEKIELDDNGNVKTGFDDQLKSLQESKGFLFVPQKDDSQPTFKGFKPFEGQENNNGNDHGKGFNLGKQLASMNKQTGQNTQQAQANYFGGMKSEV